MRRAIRATQHLSRLSSGLALLAVGSGCAAPAIHAAAPTVENPCPAWVEFPADPYSNRETAYLGCSTQTNLRTTLEDGRDSERGRELGPADGARESLAIGQYENGQTKPLQSTEPPTPTIVFSGSDGGMK